MLGAEITEMGPRSKTAILVAYGVVGWAVCGGIIGVGRQWLPIGTVLIAHAIGAPLAFGGLALLYLRKFGPASPIRLAATFLGIVVGLDALLVAPVFERSYEMFASLLGTWIPFGLIFLATYVTGVVDRAGVRRVSRIGRLST